MQGGQAAVAGFHAVAPLVLQVVEDHGGTFSLSDRGDGPGAVAEMRLPVLDGP